MFLTMFLKLYFSVSSFVLFYPCKLHKNDLLFICIALTIDILVMVNVVDYMLATSYRHSARYNSMFVSYCSDASCCNESIKVSVC